MPVGNVAEVCGGASACTQRLTVRGEPLCRMITETGRVNALTLGRLWRECAGE